VPYWQDNKTRKITLRSFVDALHHFFAAIGALQMVRSTTPLSVCTSKCCSSQMVPQSDSLASSQHVWARPAAVSRTELAARTDQHSVWIVSGRANAPLVIRYSEVARAPPPCPSYV
jgi:hypothetical protein